MSTEEIDASIVLPNKNKRSKAGPQSGKYGSDAALLHLPASRDSTPRDSVDCHLHSVVRYPIDCEVVLCLAYAGFVCVS